MNHKFNILYPVSTHEPHMAVSEFTNGRHVQGRSCFYWSAKLSRGDADSCRVSFFVANLPGLVNIEKRWKITIKTMGKSTISMAMFNMFNSFLLVYQNVWTCDFLLQLDLMNSCLWGCLLSERVGRFLGVRKSWSFLVSWRGGMSLQLTICCLHRTRSMALTHTGVSQNGDNRNHWFPHKWWQNLDDVWLPHFRPPP